MEAKDRTTVILRRTGTQTPGDNNLLLNTRLKRLIAAPTAALNLSSCRIMQPAGLRDPASPKPSFSTHHNAAGTGDVWHLTRVTTWGVGSGLGNTSGCHSLRDGWRKTEEAQSVAKGRTNTCHDAASQRVQAIHEVRVGNGPKDCAQR